MTNRTVIGLLVWLASGCTVHETLPPVTPGPSGPPPASPPLGGATQAGGGVFEQNANRAGNDYSNFPLDQPQPELCREECVKDPRCLAMTYENPKPNAPQAHCWLKNAAPRPVPDNCCVSWEKVVPPGWRPPPTPGAFELNMNYVDDSYRDFGLSDARPELCRDECLKDNRCQTFTYVRPDHGGGEKGHCWLHNRSSTPIASPCCISGTR